MNVSELTTPALVVDRAAFEHNVAEMSRALPGHRLRPHVKAHKSTALARRQADAGHLGFTCATIREVEGMAAAGLGHDLLLANEVVDARRLGAVVAAGARVTLAVDSDETVDAAAANGIREVLVDVDVGLPRCGCAPDDAGRLADRARARGLEVRGVMGYEGHANIVEDRAERAAVVARSMELLLAAHDQVGGDVVSGGATLTYDANTWVTEVQAGSFVFMDTAYEPLGDFRRALSVLATVLSVSPGHAVCDAGLKSLAMDHGKPTIEGADVWIVSDEHVTFAVRPDGSPVDVGQRIHVLPAHVDPTIALHEVIHAVGDDGEVVHRWPVDLRGW